ncbi:MAG: hypothetical protein J0I15_03540 [Herbaspirillum huttiense]|uniref:patatin-like phospholipase family protein n=1 Tax=Herbaspirillum huttiense TaxID=863372 RepID=UPI001AD54423|nr:patatin-like phospholipase family protein [Herbaspirillum huttiense]MBN9355504.1 hypothetical protein [Herbaspirillum huttiense]
MAINFVARSYVIISALLILSACSYHQLSPTERGVSFPLHSCDDAKLKAASAMLRTVPIEKVSEDGSLAPLTASDLRFDDSWVCVTAKANEASETSERGVERDSASFSEGERRLRQYVEKTFLAKDARDDETRPTLGIALSGGGSKASAFGMGVLAGLSDLDLLDKADYISSVSGGSYTAYYYFTHKVIPHLRRPPYQPIPSDKLFSDCIEADAVYMAPQVIEAISSHGGCQKTQVKTPLDASPRDTRLYNEWISPIDRLSKKNNLYQAFVRCNQDVFKPGNCSIAPTSQDFGISFPTVAGTLLLAPITLLPNMIFDWGLSTSPAARTYKDGIGLAYGSSPPSPEFLEQFYYGRDDFNYSCDKSSLLPALDCAPGIWDPNPVPLTFEELRRAYLISQKQNRSLPFWIINATAPENRMSLGLLAAGKDDKDNIDMFEMTAVSQGSGRYGYVPAPMSIHNMNVLDAVAASAAFADSNQQLYKSVAARATLGMFLQLMNFEWGYDIANYNVRDSRRYQHKVLPFPLYYLDGFGERHSDEAQKSKQMQDRLRSAYIRLTDGGNGENLGAYALMKRGVKNIVISDAAVDGDGSFKDLCKFARRAANSPIGERYPKKLYVPGLADFDKHCQAVDEPSEKGYELHKWTFTTPILLGCLRVKETESCEDLGPHDVRLFIVKPAIDMASFMNHQVGHINAHNGQTKNNLVITKCWIPGYEENDQNSKLNCTSAGFLMRNWNDDVARRCSLFPQHTTFFTTANSSSSIFSAYRDLSRQYVNMVGNLLKKIANDDKSAQEEFIRLLNVQSSEKKHVETLCRHLGT